MVDEPTREQKILDLFFTNRPALVLTCTIEPGISDHQTVVAEHRPIAWRRKPLTRKVFLWRRADFTRLRKEVTSIEDAISEKFDRTTPINVGWNFFLKEIRDIQGRCFPSKTAAVGFHQPWITTDIKRYQAYRKAMFTNKPSDWERFKEILRKTRQLAKHTYHQFLNNLMTEESEEKPQIYNKRFWSYIKSRLSKMLESPLLETVIVAQ